MLASTTITTLKFNPIMGKYTLNQHLSTMAKLDKKAKKNHQTSAATGRFNNALMAKLKQGGLVSDQRQQLKAKRFDDNYQKFTLTTLDEKTLILAIKGVDRYSFRQPVLLSVSQTEGVYDNNYLEPIADYYVPAQHDKFAGKNHALKPDAPIWLIKHRLDTSKYVVCSRKHLENNRVMASFFAQCDSMRVESDNALKASMPNLLALRQGLQTAEKNHQLIFNPNTSLPDALNSLAQYDSFGYSYLLLQRLYDDFYDEEEITAIIKITIDLLFSKQTTIDAIRKNIDIIMQKIYTLTKT